MLRKGATVNITDDEYVQRIEKKETMLQELKEEYDKLRMVLRYVTVYG